MITRANDFNIQNCVLQIRKWSKQFRLLKLSPNVELTFIPKLVNYPVFLISCLVYNELLSTCEDNLWWEVMTPGGTPELK